MPRTAVPKDRISEPFKKPIYHSNPLGGRHRIRAVECRVKQALLAI